MQKISEAKTSPRFTGCPKCRSHNWQTAEMAYKNGVRESESGYVTRSLFSQSVAPPEPRSTLAVPFAWGIGVAVSGLLLVPVILQWFLGDSQVGYGMSDKPIYIPALILGFLALLVHTVAANYYNETIWAHDYADWREQRVCRNCGNVSPAPRCTDAQ